MSGNQQDRVLERVERILGRIEALIGPGSVTPDWKATAWRWRRRRGGGELQAVTHPHRIRLAELRNIDEQKTELERNTRQFICGLPANNALLWGSRGTGKSSLVKALLAEYHDRGLRLIEVEPHDLVDLTDIVELVRGREERFIVFCDDLSFEADDASYKALKAVLDGSVAGPAENVLIYATSNRRHLLPEYRRENLETRIVDGEIHHGEAVEEKISLSERFGLWLSFYPFSQDDYLDICHAWLRELGITVLDEEVRVEALRYALSRGSRSGRVAWQFARDWAGRKGLEQGKKGDAPLQGERPL
ncbi:MAG: ATP-binding protein [Gammaproteobacteria bacterium]|jgi:predicted AAA+ superfamily ATPase|nr:ATP-binding protein [Gammaproteobacteria bacterium]